jgi:hypothetical protein
MRSPILSVESVLIWLILAQECLGKLPLFNSRVKGESCFLWLNGYSSSYHCPGMFVENIMAENNHRAQAGLFSFFDWV